MRLGNIFNGGVYKSTMDTGVHTAYICLGSNIGDSVGYLEDAQKHIAAFPCVLSIVGSAIYFTEPQDLVDQPFFANQVLKVTLTEDTSAENFLQQLLELELAMGRVRNGVMRFGPRCIDLDLLLFDDYVCDSDQLILPHPRMNQRAFVLVPLVQLEPHFVFPDGKKASELLALLDFSVTEKTIYQR